MMMSHQGTCFAVPLPDGTYLAGRVLLDIYWCLNEPGQSYFEKQARLGLNFERLYGDR